MSQPAVEAAAFNAGISEYKRGWMFAYVFFGAVVVSSLWAFWYVELLNPEKWKKAIPALADLSYRMYPPDFADNRLWIKPLFQTMAMSIGGTLMAVAAAIPLGILAAKNATPHFALYYPRE